MTTAERKYALVRLGEGDYLLPSNDGETLWRIRTYSEDGSATYHDSRGRERRVLGRFWSASKYAMPLANVAEIDGEALDDPERWREWYSGFRRRADAVEAALAA